MADWTIQALSERWSNQAGALVKRTLREEFSQILTLCTDADLDEMAKAYRLPGRRAWVALAEERVVGVIAAKETPEGALKIKRFYVDEDWRGRGVGKALHETAHAWIERQGYQYIVLTTTEPMARAQEFYRRQGYGELGTTETAATTLHHFVRTSAVRPVGTKLKVKAIPSHTEEEIGAIVERPRGYIEWWHWNGTERQLVLTEFYDRPVPVNYGFAPEWTNPADGNALDVIVMDDRRMRPGEVVLGKPVGVLWRADGDHKLLVKPKGGAVRPISFDAEYRERVSSWWDAEHQPTDWGGPDAVPRLLMQCRRRG